MSARRETSSWEMFCLQQMSISSLQNFSSRICFCTSFQKTPNWEEIRGTENKDSFFQKLSPSSLRFAGFSFFFICCVLPSEWRDSDSSPELFYVPSRFSKCIQNYQPAAVIPQLSIAQSLEKSFFEFPGILKKASRRSLNYISAIFMEADGQMQGGREGQCFQECQSEIDEDEYFGGLHDIQIDEGQRNQQLLEAITEKVASSREEEREAWKKIHELKKKEAEMTEQMLDQIQAIKEKYELLKQPIYKKISDVVLGVKVETELYHPQGFPCRGDPKRTAPLGIPNYWAEVLAKEELISSQEDAIVLSQLKEMDCALINHKQGHYRITFKFARETLLFTNTLLQMDIRIDSQTNKLVRNISEPIVYKMESNPNSMFTVLFDSSTDPQETFNLASELYQDYANSLLFYFREEDDPEEGEEEAEEEQSSQGRKGTKKVKENQKECKQQ